MKLNVCSNCGNQIKNDADKCPFCGELVRKYNEKSSPLRKFLRLIFIVMSVLMIFSTVYFMAYNLLSRIIGLNDVVFFIYNHTYRLFLWTFEYNSISFLYAAIGLYLVLTEKK